MVGAAIFCISTIFTCVEHLLKRKMEFKYLVYDIYFYNRNWSNQAMHMGLEN